jgi:serine/threonine-protein kinase
MPAPPDTELGPGSVISERYRLVELLGEGAMGVVYLAEHTHLHKQVAIKLLHPEMSVLSEIVARFEREAVAASHIEHPNVAAATDFGRLPNGTFFLVLEYVKGVRLRDVLVDGPLGVERTFHIATQIGHALSRAHGLGIVHRDLKPENVMLVERDGDPDFVKVLDFGIARVPMDDIAARTARKQGKATEAITRAGMVYGTPEYMAPEQALGEEVDARADLYALGVMLYEMLTGVRPFDAESKVQLLGMQVAAPVPSMSTKAPSVAVPPHIEALVSKFLAKVASHRPASAKDAIRELSEVRLHGESETLAPPAPVEGSESHIATPSLADTAAALPAVAPPVGAGARLETTALAQEAKAELQHALDDIRERAVPRARVLAQSLWRDSLTRIRAFYTHSPKAAVGAASVLALLLVVGTVSLFLAGRRVTSGGAPRARATASTTGSATPSAELEAVLKQMERGDVDGGKAKLAKMKVRDSDRVVILMAAARGYLATKRAREGILQLEELVALRPQVANDRDIIAAFRDAVVSGEAEDEVLAFYEAHPTGAVVDALYDLAWVLKVTSQAQERAQRALRNEAMRSAASPAAGVALDLRAAGLTCEAKRILPRAESDGDTRALPMLRDLLRPKFAKVPGHYKPQDTLGCVHGDDALKRAVAAIEARAAEPR